MSYLILKDNKSFVHQLLLSVQSGRTKYNEDMISQNSSHN